MWATAAVIPLSALLPAAVLELNSSEELLDGRWAPSLTSFEAQQMLRPHPALMTASAAGQKATNDLLQHVHDVERFGDRELQTYLTEQATIQTHVYTMGVRS